MCINNIIYNVAKCTYVIQARLNTGHAGQWPPHLIICKAVFGHLQPASKIVQDFCQTIYFAHIAFPCIHFSRFAPSPPSLWMCLGKYNYTKLPTEVLNVTVHSKCHSQGFHGHILCSPVAHSVCRGMAPSPHPSLILAMCLNVNKS